MVWTESQNIRTCIRNWLPTLNTTNHKQGIDGNRNVLLQKQFVCQVSLYQDKDISCLSPYGLKLPKSLNNYREQLKISPLAGETTSSGVVLNDPEDGKPRIYFTFPDLSSRIIGTFQLKIIVVDLESLVYNEPILTEPFVIYSLKEFQSGGREPDALAKSFALQGIYCNRCSDFRTKHLIFEEGKLNFVKLRLNCNHNKVFMTV